MARLLFICLLASVLAYLTALQCYNGTRTYAEHPHISYPPRPVLVDCPVEATCCKSHNFRDAVSVFFSCATDCPEFGTSNAVTSPVGNTLKIPMNIGNSNWTWWCKNANVTECKFVPTIPRDSYCCIQNP